MYGSLSPLTPPPPTSRPPSSSTSVVDSGEDYGIEKSFVVREEKAHKLLSILRSLGVKNSKLTEGEGLDERQRHLYEVEVLEILLRLNTRLLRQGVRHHEGAVKNKDLFFARSSTRDHDSANRKRQKRVKVGVAANVLTNDQDGGATSKTDEDQWLLALERILSSGRTSEQDGERRQESLNLSNFVYPPAIVEAAAHCIGSLCCFTKNSILIRSNTNEETAGRTLYEKEEESIFVHSGQWLFALACQVKRCLALMDRRRRYFGIPSNLNGHDTHQVGDGSAGGAYAAASCATACLDAASGIVSLLGNRLSRVNRLASTLHDVAWAALGSHCGNVTINVRHPKMTRSAAVLVSTLPFLGSGHMGDGNTKARSQSPSRSWKDAVEACLGEICTTVNSTWSSRNRSLSNFAGQFPLFEEDEWLKNFCHTVTTQLDRRSAVLHRLTGLVHVVLSLLNFDCLGVYDHNQSLPLLDVQLPLRRAIAVCESLVKFGSGAERKFTSITMNATEATLPPEGSFLSLNGALSLAIPIRCLGHDLLVAFMTAGQEALLMHGKTVANLVHVSLESSCSSALQRQSSSHAIGGGCGSLCDTKWLHKAVTLRRKSITSVKVALLCLGSSATPHLCRSAVFISGCLLEVFVMGDFSFDDGGDWATLGEKVALAIESIDSLSTFIAVGGSLIPVSCRAVLEGVVASCLSTITSNPMTSSSYFSAPKVALLKLATNAVCSPWTDGGISTLMGKLRETASIMKSDRDSAVSLAAYSALCTCDAFSTPRAPPLVVTSRSDDVVIPSTPNCQVRKLEDELKVFQMEVKQERGRKKGNDLWTYDTQLHQAKKSTASPTRAKALRPSWPLAGNHRTDEVKQAKDERETKKENVESVKGMNAGNEPKSVARPLPSHPVVAKPRTKLCEGSGETDEQGKDVKSGNKVDEREHELRVGKQGKTEKDKRRNEKNMFVNDKERNQDLPARAESNSYDKCNSCERNKNFSFKDNDRMNRAGNHTDEEESRNENSFIGMKDEGACSSLPERKKEENRRVGFDAVDNFGTSIPSSNGLKENDSEQSPSCGKHVPQGSDGTISEDDLPDIVDCDPDEEDRS